MTPNWLKIDKNNLPKGEVLCANFADMTHGYAEKLYGFLYLDSEGKLECNCGDTVLENVTHYLPLPKDEEIEG